MTNPVPPVVPIAPGVLANVTVKVLAVNAAAQTATIRVVDNNGAFLTVAVDLPFGVITATEFGVVVGDVLESADEKQTTGVVRWTDGLMWSESPTGVPSRSTAGWRKIGNIAIPD